MKKIFALTLFTMFSTSAFSAATSTLLLQANIPRILSIAVTPAPVATALDMSVTQTDLFIGRVNEKSNSKTGYKGTVSSLNLGKLKRTDGSEVFPYTLKIEGQSIDLSTAAGTTYYFSNTQLVDTNRPMNISYNGIPSEQMVEGTYNDIITFSISAI